MNEHPLSEDLSKLGNDELDKKYNELSRRWQLARRMGMDEYVMHQLDIMLSGMESEKQRRLMLPEDHKHVVLDTDPIIKKTSEKK
jgi:hypothetical protein